MQSSEDEAVRIAAELGAPVVMKGISGQVTHRAAAGLVALDLNSETDVRKAWRLIQDRAASLSVALDGFTFRRWPREALNCWYRPSAIRTSESCFRLAPAAQ